jgi:hypothetical protein
MASSPKRTRRTPEHQTELTLLRAALLASQGEVAAAVKAAARLKKGLIAVTKAQAAALHIPIPATPHTLIPTKAWTRCMEAIGMSALFRWNSV